MYDDQGTIGILSYTKRQVFDNSNYRPGNLGIRGVVDVQKNKGERR